MYNIAEITINYKPTQIIAENKKISSSKCAYKIFKQDWEHLSYKESFKILLLNTANEVLGISLISVGGLAGTFLDPKNVFQIALKANAAHIILAHNHPSGNLKPSEQDIKMTKRLVETGRLLDLNVLDHIILTDNHFYSFGDEGLI